MMQEWVQSTQGPWFLSISSVRHLKKKHSIAFLSVFIYICHKHFFACESFLFSDLAFKKRWVGGREDLVCFDNPWPCSCCHSCLPMTCQWGWLSSSGHFSGDADREHFLSGLSSVDASCHLIVSGEKGPFEIYAQSGPRLMACGRLFFFNYF